MIVPMKKVSLVVLDRYKEEALKKLRNLGLVHVEQMQGNSEKLSSSKAVYSRLELASILLSDIKIDKKNPVKSISVDNDEAVLKAEDAINLFESKKNFTEELSNALKEKERLTGWGGVTPEDFEYLAQKGLFLSMYEIPAESYSKIPETVKTLYVSSSKSLTRFLTVCETKERPQELPPEAFAVAMPDLSSSELEENIASYRSELADIALDITASTAYLPSIIKAMKVLEKDIEFENIYSGMEIEGTETSHALTWLTGFIPAADAQKVIDLSKKEHWACLLSDPAEEDEVPTKLKNNKFVSLIYPVSDFLGTVPGYREYDISGWFLLFFCVFFGMIFGDGGYGLLLSAVAVFTILKTVMSKKPVNPALNLLLLLGITTTIWGTVTCTWFGLTPQQLPDWIKNLSIPLLSNATSVISPEKEAWVKENMQVFCFILALIQLSVAHIKGIVRNIKSLKLLGELGSLLMLWGIFNIVLNMVVNAERFPILNEAMILIAAGFGLSFIFSSYEGNIVQSILSSLKNIVSVLLGVVNVFSDIVSYIRLWAVGLAGSAISLTVNEMAGPTLGGFIIFLGIILLVFGHGLNMVLNVLSVIVHGVRLNTLEFSSHLGMSWSGFKYKPFSETVEK
ncbi:MAG TPA: V-type ATPase 116kDa subunit family protein [Treponemataceae bacterium]|nr:V-type ATPase 116kDa subunit family protein [Treponemataceae bacterium]